MLLAQAQATRSVDQVVSSRSPRLQVDFSTSEKNGWTIATFSTGAKWKIQMQTITFISLVGRRMGTAVEAVQPVRSIVAGHQAVETVVALAVYQATTARALKLSR